MSERPSLWLEPTLLQLDGGASDMEAHFEYKYQQNDAKTAPYRNAALALIFNPNRLKPTGNVSDSIYTEFLISLAMQWRESDYRRLLLGPGAFPAENVDGLGSPADYVKKVDNFFIGINPSEENIKLGEKPRISTVGYSNLTYTDLGKIDWLGAPFIWLGNVKGWSSQDWIDLRDGLLALGMVVKESVSDPPIWIDQNAYKKVTARVEGNMQEGFAWRDLPWNLRWRTVPFDLLQQLPTSVFNMNPQTVADVLALAKTHLAKDCPPDTHFSAAQGQCVLDKPPLILVTPGSGQGNVYVPPGGVPTFTNTGGGSVGGGGYGVPGGIIGGGLGGLGGLGNLGGLGGSGPGDGSSSNEGGGDTQPPCLFPFVMDPELGCLSPAESAQLAQEMASCAASGGVFDKKTRACSGGGTKPTCEAPLELDPVTGSCKLPEGKRTEAEEAIECLEKGYFDKKSGCKDLPVKPCPDGAKREPTGMCPLSGEGGGTEGGGTEGGSGSSGSSSGSGLLIVGVLAAAAVGAYFLMGSGSSAVASPARKANPIEEKASKFASDIHRYEKEGKVGLSRSTIRSLFSQLSAWNDKGAMEEILLALDVHDLSEGTMLEVISTSARYLPYDNAAFKRFRHDAMHELRELHGEHGAKDIMRKAISRYDQLLESA